MEDLYELIEEILDVEDFMAINEVDEDYLDELINCIEEDRDRDAADEFMKMFIKYFNNLYFTEASVRERLADYVISLVVNKK